MIIERLIETATSQRTFLCQIKDRHCGKQHTTHWWMIQIRSPADYIEVQTPDPEPFSSILQLAGITANRKNIQIVVDVKVHSSLQFYCNCLPLSHLIDQQTLLFYKRLHKSDNYILCSLLGLTIHSVAAIQSKLIQYFIHSLLCA